MNSFCLADNEGKNLLQDIYRSSVLAWVTDDGSFYKTTGI